MNVDASSSSVGQSFDSILNLAKTDLEAAVKEVGNISEKKVRSKAICKIVEQCVFNQSEKIHFVKALTIIETASFEFDPTRSLEKTERNAQYAHDEKKMSDDDLANIIERVNNLAVHFGVNPHERADKRVAETNRIKEIALQERNPARAFYHAASIPTRKIELVAEIVKKHTSTAILAASNEIFAKEIENYIQRKDKAVNIPLTDDKRNKELDTIAFEFLKMGSIKEAFETVQNMTPGSKKDHFSQGRFFHVLSIIAPDRIEEFQKL